MAEGIGQKLVMGISVYLILKSILNLILGLSAGNVVMLGVFILFVFLLWKRIPYINYILAGYLALLFLVNVGNNLANLSSNWIYLVEGLLDVGSAALLTFQKDVKSYFKR